MRLIKTITKRIKFLVAVCFLAAFIFTAYTLYTNHVKQQARKEAFNIMSNMQIPDAGRIMNKMRLENIVVNHISQKQELVTTEVELTGEVVFDDSWSDNIFRKTQNVTYFAIGKYSTDLNVIKADNIIYDHENLYIMLQIDEPQISSLEIQEDRTIIEGTDTGLLRFGQIEFTTAEFNSIMAVAKEQMRKDMQSGELMEQAKDNTQVAIQQLFEIFLKDAGFGEYTVIVDWR